ncbi:hypothetical protein ADL00_29800 [Streptomyces sp. AS58]|uniref:hypothetical protein n=1 Tax=Streptomyces sp. AS58 TaxID=1519489 RepID=UPI0006C3C94E|nr:hypothetical protein [Streptomyces sp. AS58]KOV54579.1 hypothetical protein ADL00_29800 [Streptomyces sp. AS58]
MAVVQPLPERMWRRTALPGTPGRVHAPAAGSANSGLIFTAYDGTPHAGADSIPVPVLEPSSVWLENWFTLLGSGGTEVPAAVAFIPQALPAEETASPARPTAEELVLRFRATASPEAFRLAGHLAAGVPHLPVMQQVHRSVETAPCPSHLAEVILSGLLRAVPGPPGPTPSERALHPCCCARCRVPRSPARWLCCGEPNRRRGVPSWPRRFRGASARRGFRAHIWTPPFAAPRPSSTV